MPLDLSRFGITPENQKPQSQGFDPSRFGVIPDPTQPKEQVLSSEDVSAPVFAPSFNQSGEPSTAIQKTDLPLPETTLEPPSLGDHLKNAGIGLLKGAMGTAQLPFSLTNLVGNLVNEDFSDTAFGRATTGASDFFEVGKNEAESLNPQTIRDQKNIPMFDEETGDFNPDGLNASKVTGVLTEVAPQIPLFMLAGGPAAKIATRAGATAGQAAGVAGATGGTLVASGQVFEEARNEAGDILRSKQTEDGRPVFSEEEVQAISQKAAAIAAKRSAPASLVLSAVGLGPAFRHSDKGLVMRVLFGAGADAPFEALEGAFQQQEQNRALAQGGIDPNRKETEGVLESGVLEAIGGAGIGGAIAGVNPGTGQKSIEQINEDSKGGSIAESLVSAGSSLPGRKTFDEAPIQDEPTITIGEDGKPEINIPISNETKPKPEETPQPITGNQKPVSEKPDSDRENPSIDEFGTDQQLLEEFDDLQDKADTGTMTENERSRFQEIERELTRREADIEQQPSEPLPPEPDPDLPPEVEAEPDETPEVEGITQDVPEKPAFRVEVVRESDDSFASEMVDKIASGNMPKTNPEMTKALAAKEGVKPSELTEDRKLEAQQELEWAVNENARNIIESGSTETDIFSKLVDLYSKTPNLNLRSSETIRNQAFSTPTPLSYLAGLLGRVDKNSKVFDPTAGNGSLLITAARGNVTANEIDPVRVGLLKKSFTKVSESRAGEGAAIAAPKSQDVVLLNPPFGKLPRKVKYDGFNINTIEHLIALESLEAMKDDGRAVIITGGRFKPGGGIGKRTEAQRVFENYLYSRYNVADQFQVDGKLYSRHGASFPLMVYTVAGRTKSEQLSPEGDILVADTWKQVKERFDHAFKESADIRSDQPQRGTTGTRVRDGGDDAADGATASDESGPRGIDDESPGSSDGGGRTEPAGISQESGGSAGSGTGVRGAGESRPVRSGGNADERPGDGSPIRRPDLPAEADSETSTAEGDAVLEGGVDVGGTSEPDSDEGSSLEENQDDLQTPYSSLKVKGASKSPSIDALIPSNHATPVKENLELLVEKYGPLDAFVQKELGYKTKKELFKALMGIQIDAVAGAIHNAKNGKAMIIADQTGIGKGRQAAAMARWAKRQGFIPVLITVDADLFSATYRDLDAIGSPMKPFTFNDHKTAAITDNITGKTIHPRIKKKDIQSGVSSLAEGKMPKGYDAVFLTYSQVGDPKKMEAKVKALEGIADKAFLILDESHKAGGAGQAKGRFGGKVAEPERGSNTFRLFSRIIPQAKGVTFLSATWSKRPDTLPLYSRTDLSTVFGGDVDGLIEAAEKGGVPFQNLVSAELVRSGQLVRRERSMEGISLDFEAPDPETAAGKETIAAQEKASDEITRPLRAIVRFSSYFHKHGVSAINSSKPQTAAGSILSGLVSLDNGRVQGTNFSSTVHNAVKQMLLGLKADSIADRAIKTLKEGRKPVIAVENTMGSFLEGFVEANNLSIGDDLGAFGWADVLEKQLAATLKVKQTAPNGDVTHTPINPADLTGTAAKLYAQAQEAIDEMDIRDVPVSPIDWINHRIEKAGYKAGEITGRSTRVDYSGKTPRLARRDKNNAESKTNMRVQFQSGKLDSVILNASGSTGIDLHSDKAVGDTRQRNMIIGQAAADINVFLQIMGRVNRNNQVSLPIYSIETAGIPAEKRPASILQGKLSMLNANTNSSGKSAFRLRTDDILNVVGDRVVFDFIQENKAFAEEVGAQKFADMDSGASNEAIEGIAKKVTGHLGIQPVENQKRFWDSVLTRYREKIDLLNQAGTNPLEQQFLDLQAKPDGGPIIIKKGVNQESGFQADVLMQRFEVKRKAATVSPERVQKEIEGAQSAESITKKADSLAKVIVSRGTKIDPEVEAKTKRGWKEYDLGKTFTLEFKADESEEFEAVVVKIAVTKFDSASGNLFAPSRTKITFQGNKGQGRVTVPLSVLFGEDSPVKGAIKGVGMDEIFSPENSPPPTEIRSIITHNLISGINEVKQGKIIDFTTRQGDRLQGVLLPKSFDPDSDLRREKALNSSQEVLDFLRNAKKGRDVVGIRDDNEGLIRDIEIRLLENDFNGIRIKTPAAKSVGGRFFLDDGLTKITGPFFGTRGQTMSVDVSGKDAREALDYLLQRYPLHGLSQETQEELNERQKAEVFTKDRDNPFSGTTLNAGFPVVAVKKAYKGLVGDTFDRASEAMAGRFAPLGNLPEEDYFLTERYKTLGKLAKIDDIAKKIFDAFDGSTHESKEQAFEYMTTKDADPRAIHDPAIRTAAIDAKKAILITGKKLVKAGLLSQETFEKHEGEYLPRVYLKHILNVDGPIGAGGGKKTSDLGFLKQRKDIPEEIRRIILGEIRDPGFLASKGYAQPMRDMAILELLDTVAQNPEWIFDNSVTKYDGHKVSVVWLTQEGERLINQAAFMVDQRDADKAIAIGKDMLKVAQSKTAGNPDLKEFRQVPDSRRYGRLRGMWVRKEIFSDLIGVGNIITGQESIAEQILAVNGKLSKITQLWKLSKVALNPPTQIRNITSNAILLNISGIPLHKIPIRLGQAVKQIRSGGRHWDVAKKFGVSNTTFAQNELLSIQREFLRLEAAEGGVWAKIKGYAGAIATKASDFYGASEAVFKTAKIIHEMESNGLTEEEAALEGHKWLFDYSLVPASVRTLRSAPIGMPFLTFYYKAFPRVLEVAAKNPLRYAPYLALPYLFSQAIANLYDVDEEDVDKLKQALPFWLKNRSNVYIFPFKDQHGRWQAADIGYFFPWSPFQELYNEASQGEASEFLGTTGLLGGPIPDIIAAVKTNKDPFTKRDIARKGDTPSQQVADWMKYIWRLGAPTWVTDIGAANHLWRTLSGSVDPRTGRPRLTEMQATLRFLGLNVYPIKPNESRSKNIARMQFEIKDTKRAMRAELKDLNLTQDQRKAIVEDYKAYIQQLNDALIQYQKDSTIPENLR